MSELLHLIWISHNSKIVYNFQQLHEKQLFCDATIVCDGSYFPVHRLVLSSCSQYFEQIFEETPCKHPFIVLKDVEVEIFRDVVEFMYKGEVKILHNRLPTFISIANSLKVQGISSSNQLKASKSTEDGTSNIEHLNEESGVERERIVAVNVPKVGKKSTSESSLPSHTNTHHLKKAGERKRELVCSSWKPEKKIRLSQKADNEVCDDTSDTNYNDTNETNDGGNDIEDTKTTENNDDDDENFLAILKAEEFQDEIIEISFPDITKLENESDLTSLPSCSKFSISLDGVGSPTNNEVTKEKSSEANSSEACMNGSTTSLTANSGGNAGRDQASGFAAASTSTEHASFPVGGPVALSDIMELEDAPSQVGDVPSSELVEAAPSMAGIGPASPLSNSEDSQNLGQEVGILPPSASEDIAPQSPPEVATSSGERQKNSERSRPKRLCIFCKRKYRDLSIHLLHVHAEEKSIRQLNGLSKKDRDHSLRLIRVAGINEENEQRRQKNLNPIYTRKQEKTLAEMVKCLNCLGLFGKNGFYLHRKNCTKECGGAKNQGYTSAIKSLHKSSRLVKPFKTVILNTIYRDAIGKFILSNEEIQLLGFNYYEDIHARDKISVKKSVSTHMRAIARLYYKVKEQLNKNSDIEKEPTVFEIFNKENVILINLTTRVLSDKHGKYLAAMHRNYGYEIRRVIRSLLEIYNDRNNEVEVERVKSFRNAFENKWAKFYKKAEVTTTTTKKETKRPPGDLPPSGDGERLLPPSGDVKRLLNFLEEEFDSFNRFPFWDSSHFLRLRKALLCKLTILHGRRPNEVAELEIKGWMMAKCDKDIPRYQISNLPKKQQEILNDYKVTYNRSKNISLFFPRNIWKSMDLIVNQEIRAAAGINHKNNYVFPSMNKSESFCSPWHDVKSCCYEAQVDPNLCSVDNRHQLASTIGTQITDATRDLLLSHFGHSRATNEQLCQKAERSRKGLKEDSLNLGQEIGILPPSASEDNAQQFPPEVATSSGEQDSLNLGQEVGILPQSASVDIPPQSPPEIATSSGERKKTIDRFLKKYPDILKKTAYTTETKKEKISFKINNFKKMHALKIQKQLTSK